MPSTDIDGSPIHIMGKKDAILLVNMASSLRAWNALLAAEADMIERIARTFDLDAHPSPLPTDDRGPHGGVLA